MFGLIRKYFELLNNFPSLREGYPVYTVHTAHTLVMTFLTADRQM